MAAITLNLEIIKGITFGPLDITAKDEAGDVVDLTGYTPIAHARVNPDRPVSFDLAPALFEFPP